MLGGVFLLGLSTLEGNTRNISLLISLVAAHDEGTWCRKLLSQHRGNHRTGKSESL